MSHDPIHLLPQDPDRTRTYERGDTVTSIKKRENLELQAAIEIRDEVCRAERAGEEPTMRPRVMSLRDLPPVPEEEKGRLYTEEEVGWLLSPEPAYVELTWKQRMLLRKMVCLVSFSELSDLEAEGVEGLLDSIDHPFSFSRR